jgi:ring-1,2-phenylacetyl-CoA epoxidase subunit PaaD
MNKESIYQILASVPDPEIPIISIEELGVLRDIEIVDDKIRIYITPTYSGCPAMDMITVQIKAALQEVGYSNVEIVMQMAPPWTTDWLTESAKAKLRAYGIEPPQQKTSDLGFIRGDLPRVSCPLCGSANTELISLFGSTACKSLYKCVDCLEPFDYFKCH